MKKPNIGCALIHGHWIKAKLKRRNISSLAIVLLEDHPLAPAYVTGTEVTVGSGEWKPLDRCR